MSDLFIGEILTLLLLLPVLIRPFSRRLQRIDGIPLLPLLALLLCVAIAVGMGFKLTFLPIFAFTVLVFFSGLIRLFRLFFALPTDWYRPLTVVLHFFLLALYAATAVTSFLFAPESSYMTGVRVERTMDSQLVSRGVRGNYHLLNATGGASGSLSSSGSGKPVVIFLGDTACGADGRSTASLVLAEAGYTVISADFSGMHDFENLLLSSPSVREFASVSGKLFAGKPFLTNREEIVGVQEENMARLYRYARKSCGETVPVFAVAEGDASLAAFRFMAARPESLSGAFIILNDTDVSGVIPPSGDSAASGGYLRLEGIDGMMPENPDALRVLVLTGTDKGLYGLGELSSDDVFAAVLSGSVRDSGRKKAELAGRRIASWFSDRRTHDGT